MCAGEDWVVRKYVGRGSRTIVAGSKEAGTCTRKIDLSYKDEILQSADMS